MKLDLSFLNNLKNMNRNTILICIAVIAVIITAGLILGNQFHSFSFPAIFGISDKQIGKNVIDYINNNQLSQTPATLIGVSEEAGLIKVKIKIGSNEYDSYATKDGKLLFPEAIDMTPKKAAAGAKADSTASGAGQTAAQIIASIAKTDKPSLEAYIVSRCPFGLQMQRMIADAVKSVPALAQNIKVKYIGSVSGNIITAMHGEAEATENLRQICIRDEQPAKYWSYVSCQMKAAGTETSCEKSTGVDSAKLSTCISDTSRGVAFAQKDFDLANKYSISGSPTLILNGKEVAEFTSDGKPVFGSSRSSDELKTIICEASKTQPSFCSTKLNTAQAASSFSASYGNTSAASATTGAAGCEAAQ